MTVSPVLVLEEMFATWVPAKAKKRKDMVPTSSPMTATVCPRVVGGRRRRRVRTGLEEGVVGAVVFIVSEVRTVGMLERRVCPDCGESGGVAYLLFSGDDSRFPDGVRGE